MNDDVMDSLRNTIATTSTAKIPINPGAMHAAANAVYAQGTATPAGQRLGAREKSLRVYFDVQAIANGYLVTAGDPRAFQMISDQPPTYAADMTAVAEFIIARLAAAEMDKL